MPDVDVVIAVHRATRPIERAVESVLGGGLGPDRLRVTVVCHNLAGTSVAERLRALAGASTGRAFLPAGVRVLELHDGTASPAGPFNHGIDCATGRFVSVMGSDDTVGSGAYADWLEIADALGSAAVIAPVRTTGSGRVPTPVPRPGRSRHLDPLRDRLVYRTAPLGLVRRSEIHRRGLRFTAGLASGEDQEFTARLWFGGGRIDYATRSGSYLVHDDQHDRSTHVRREVTDLFEFATRLVSGDWFRSQSAPVREALVTKLLRVHFVPAIPARTDVGGWAPGDRAELRTVVDTLVRSAPGALESLSLAERRTVTAAGREDVTSEELVRLARAARRFPLPATLLPARVGALARPDVATRWVLASGAIRLGDKLAAAAPLARVGPTSRRSRAARRQRRSSAATARSNSSMPERS